MESLQNLLSDLVRFESITPQDQGCQNYMMDFLKDLGFECHQFNQGKVSNFFATYGCSGPLLVFAGHTDVVPPGDLDLWDTDPFILSEREGFLYGRGTADMKGSLACMLHMAERFVKNYPEAGRMGFLITSAEEGEDYNLGTPYVMAQLKKQGIKIDYCIVGEPSSNRRTGDVVKIGRRGSLHAKIDIHGKQGHVAYPHLAKNPVHLAAAFLSELCNIEWDLGNEHFPPTSMQITRLHSGGIASNVIPGLLVINLNFRYSTEQSTETLQVQVEKLLKKFQLVSRTKWTLSGEPFLTSTGVLLDKTIAAIKEISAIKPELSTAGGTSDGRFIAPYGVEVIELGPVNASIHQINERVSLKDLQDLEAQYYLISEALLVSANNKN